MSMKARKKIKIEDVLDEYEVTLAAGEESEFEFMEDGSTGFIWSIDTERSSGMADVRFMSSASPANDGPVVFGGASPKLLIIKATGPGKSVVIYVVLARPWLEDAPDRRVKITVIGS